MPSLHEELALAFRTARERLEFIVLSPTLELELLMAAIDDLKALDARLQAVLAAIPNDTATAVAAAVAPLNDEIATLNAAAATTESNLAAEVTALTPTVSGLETAVGIAPPAAPVADPVVDPNAPA